MSEIIFEVLEDEVDGGYVATALGHGIVTQGKDRKKLEYSFELLRQPI